MAHDYRPLPHLSYIKLNEIEHGVFFLRVNLRFLLFFIRASSIQNVIFIFIIFSKGTFAPKAKNPKKVLVLPRNQNFF